MTYQIFWPPTKDLSELFEVDLTTARRWRRGAICPPKSVAMVLSKDLGIFAAEWRGWMVNGPLILPPGGWPIRRDDALSVPLMHQQIAALRSEVAKLKAQLEAIHRMPEQPLPAQWQVK